jgi:benzodiazapine receptor
LRDEVPGMGRNMTTTKANTLVKTSMAAGAAAGIGGLASGTGASTSWYRRLDKPPWQPPPRTFGIVWPVLYGMIAYSTGRAMDRAPQRERQAISQALGVNLALNTAWTWLFFRARSPRTALADIAALNASNALLVRRVWTADRRAGLLLLPYAAWTAFATLLNGDIARRNG